MSNSRKFSGVPSDLANNIGKVLTVQPDTTLSWNVSVDTVARVVANSASSNTIYSQGVDATQNTNITYLLGALTQTNSNIVTANTNLKSYVDGQVSTKVSKSGDTMTGALFISNTSGQALYVGGTVYFN